jgi:phosphatidylinositol-3-phosphatase
VTASTDDESRDEGGVRACAGCGAPIAGKRDQCLECRFMPSPWAAAVAVMGMLTLGVLLGSVSSQVAQSAGLTSILLEAPAAAPPPSAPSAATPAEASAAPVPASLPTATTSSLPIAAPAAEAPPPEAAPEPPPSPEFFEEEEALPLVKHVFLIVLGENSFEEAFGATSPAPYLARTLAAKGELLSNYYAVTKGVLANQVALLSGQGPTVETAAECPSFADIAPGTISPEGQVEGAGCAYPATIATLLGQLAEKKLSWKAYVEDRAVPCVREEGSRDPLVYFHSLTDRPECASVDVGLEQLAADLKTATRTPTLSYIVPNPCHAGAELACEPRQPAGPLAAEEFLKRIVPAIEASPAYKEGGLIAITSAQARQTGPAPDVSSCCISPVYPNLPPEAAAEPSSGPVKPSGGGGRVGLLLLSPFVAPGTVNESGYFNHYSLLKSIGELFELEPLGYAAEVALTGFDASVYNYETSSNSASCRDCASRVPSADQSSPSSSKNPWRAVLDLKAIR